MDLGASDIHLERFDRRIDLRLRVDGMLADQPPPPGELYEALISRIKIMASLDLAERRRAQDRRIRMRLRGRNVDMRVSIVPTLYGQDAAIRIQDRQKRARSRWRTRIRRRAGEADRGHRDAAERHAARDGADGIRQNDDSARSCAAW